MACLARRTAEVSAGRACLLNAPLYTTTQLPTFEIGRRKALDRAFTVLFVLPGPSKNTSTSRNSSFSSEWNEGVDITTH